MSKKKPDVWMPFFVGDYLGATSRLSTAQHGAYVLLILDYWMNGPPPDDEATLARIVRASSEEWAMIRAVLVGYFQVQDGKWRHTRIDKELVSAHRRKERAVAKAELGAKARWDAPSKAPGNAPNNAPSHTPSKAPSKAQASPEHISSSPNRVSSSHVDSGFVENIEQKPPKTRQNVLQVLPEAMPNGMLKSCPSPSPSHIKTKSKSKSKSKSKPGRVTSPTLPGWLDVRVWEEYKAHRKALRAGLTPQSEEKQLKALAKIHAAGRDPNAAIEHSIAQGWRGIFEANGARPKEKDGAEEYLNRFRNVEKEVPRERDE